MTNDRKMVRLLRHKRGWSVAELARRSGLSFEAVRRCEDGRSNKMDVWNAIIYALQAKVVLVDLTDGQVIEAGGIVPFSSAQDSPGPCNSAT